MQMQTQGEGGWDELKIRIDDIHSAVCVKEIASVGSCCVAQGIQSGGL